MSQSAYDPFGEPIPATDPSVTPNGASKWIKSAGIGLFWGLVGITVLARAVYFEPGDLSFERVVAWAQSLLVSL